MILLKSVLAKIHNVMTRILANDGLAEDAIAKLQEAGFQVNTEKVPQAELGDALQQYDAVIVRSSTIIGKEVIDSCPNLQFIGRAGTGMDNISVDYAKSKGIEVVNTPAAASESVAELVFAHAFSIARNLYHANRKMPDEAENNFKELKKSFSNGHELRGKTLGVIGFGRIGQCVARIGLGLGMNVLPFKLHAEAVKIFVDFFEVKNASIAINMETTPFDQLLAESDIITIHVPYKEGDPPVLYQERFNKMKDGVIIINTSRGGVIKEEDLLGALDSGKVGAAGLDVYENEPTPDPKLLHHPQISLTPHIGASTKEAQQRVGLEIAQKVIEFFQ